MAQQRELDLQRPMVLSEAGTLPEALFILKIFQLYWGIVDN